jgi:hypothetical protein
MPRKWINSEGINVDTERKQTKDLENLRKQVITNYNKPKDNKAKQYPMKNKNRNYNKKG